MRGTIEIEGKPIKFEANGATPVMYRRMFHSDFLVEMKKLNDQLKATGSIEDLSPVENLAYLMAWQADPESVPGAIEEWLAGFEDPLSIYVASNEIMRLWNLSAGKVSELKKKQKGKSTGR